MATAVFLHGLLAVPAPNPMRGCCVGHHIRFGVDNNTIVNSPLFYFDKRGNPDGYVPAVVDRLAAEMGFTYNFTVYETFEQLGVGLMMPKSTNEGRPSPLGVMYSSLDAILVDSHHRNAKCSSALRFVEDGASGSDALQCLLDLGSSTTTAFHGLGDFTVGLTTPLLTTYMSGLTKKTIGKSSGWSMVMPFTPDLWLAIFICITVGVVSVKLVHPAEPGGEDEADRAQKPRSSLAAAVRSALGATAESLYHVVALVLGGEELEWATSWQARLVRLAFLVLALVLVAMYTANLAGLAVVPTVVVYPPLTIGQLPHSKACVWNEYLFGDIAARYTSDVIAPPNTSTAPFAITAPPDSSSYAYGDAAPPPPPPDIAQSFAEWTAFCRASIQDGTSDVWIADEVLLRREHLADCSHTALADFIRIAPNRYSFATYAGSSLVSSNDEENKKMLFGTALAVNLSKGLTFFEATPDSQAAANTYLKLGEQCDSDGGGDDGMDPVSSADLFGLFVTCGSMVAVALLGTVCQWLEATARLLFTPRRPQQAEIILTEQTGPRSTEL